MARAFAMSCLLIALLGTAVLHTANAAIFPAKGAVIPLSKKSWSGKLKDGNLAIVAFTAPWCGHCKSLAPEYQKAAESLNPLIPFYNIDCDEQENKALCAAEDVKGFPTIKAYTKSGKGRGRTFERERKAGPIIEWASDQIPSTKVKKLRQPSEISAWKSAKPDQAHALLIHPSNPSLPLMWKVLSDRLSEKIHFGFIKDERAEAKDALGISTKDKKTDGVKVVTWTSEGEQDVYTAGPLKFEPLLAYLQSVSRGEIRGGNDDESVTMFETTIITTTVPETAAPAPTEDKAAKLREQRAKWEEEERRDRIRREKREQDRLAQIFEEQDRVTDDDDAQEDSGPQVISKVTPAAQPGVAQSARSGAESRPSPDQTAADPAVPMQPGQTSIPDAVSTTTGPEQTIELEQRKDDQSATLPLEVAADDFEHGESDAPTTKTPDQSAATPLEEEAAEFESGQHEVIWDESPTEDRVRDEL